MEHVIFHYAQHLAKHGSFLAYIFFFVNSSLQALFPPYPGDSIIVFQGYIGTLRLFNNPLMVFFTLLGTVTCGTLLFLLCHKHGDKITSHRFFTKFFNVNKIKSLKKVFNKYGAGLIVFNWFVPGLAMITVMAAGIFKVNRLKAIASLSIAGIAHNLLLMGLGFSVGHNLPLLKSILHRFEKLFILLAIILAIFMALMYFRKTRKERKNQVNCTVHRKKLVPSTKYTFTRKTGFSIRHIKKRIY